MSKAPLWSKQEFESLLQNNHLSDDQLAQLLSRRTAGAVNWVRSGIHNYHRGGNVTMLSKLMLERLQESDGQIICPHCSFKI